MKNHVTAFIGDTRVSSGDVVEVAALTKAALDETPGETCLVFDDETGRLVEIDFRGTLDEVVARLGTRSPPPRGPGRPKLGVVAKEVTLMPRHWEWLAQQPGGASAALRRLVERARRESIGADAVRTAQEACFRFVNAAAGNQPGFEEALRALFEPDPAKFERETAGWPADIREYAMRLASPAFSHPG